MRISCPNCQSVFMLEKTSFNLASKLKCSRCKHIWYKESLNLNEQKITLAVKFRRFFQNFAALCFKISAYSLLTLILLSVIIHYSNSYFTDLNFKILVNKLIINDKSSVTLFLKIEKNPPVNQFTFLKPSIIHVTFLQDEKIIISKFIKSNFPFKLGDNIIVKSNFNNINTEFNKIDLKCISTLDFLLVRLFKNITSKLGIW